MIKTLAESSSIREYSMGLTGQVADSGFQCLVTEGVRLDVGTYDVTTFSLEIGCKVLNNISIFFIVFAIMQFLSCEQPLYLYRKRPFAKFKGLSMKKKVSPVVVGCVDSFYHPNG